MCVCMHACVYLSAGARTMVLDCCCGPCVYACMPVCTSVLGQGLWYWTAAAGHVCMHACLCVPQCWGKDYGTGLLLRAMCVCMHACVYLSAGARTMVLDCCCGPCVYACMPVCTSVLGQGLWYVTVAAGHVCMHACLCVPQCWGKDYGTGLLLRAMCVCMHACVYLSAGARTMVLDCCCGPCVYACMPVC